MRVFYQAWSLKPILQTVSGEFPPGVLASKAQTLSAVSVGTLSLVSIATGQKERKAIMKQWAKREEQIESVMGATVGIYGDLHGIAGKSLQEIEGLELSALGMDATEGI